MKTPAELLKLMDYTRYDESCLDMTITTAGELVECRLPKLGHPEEIHATRKGAYLIEWTRE